VLIQRLQLGQVRNVDDGGALIEKHQSVRRIDGRRPLTFIS
jgi:hypothetical protein